MSAVALTIYQGLAGDHNARAVAGARALGTALEQQLGVTGSVVGTPGTVLNAHWDVELGVARDSLRDMAVAVDRVFTGAARPLSVLTRCAVALATLPVVSRHHPDACIVWFDAHADLNTPTTSPSGYLGGMALAGAAGLWDSGLGSGLQLPNVVLVGTRDVDPPEQVLIETSGLRHVPVGPDLAAGLRKALAARHVYVHLDCDVLDAGVVPTDYAVAGGLTPAQLREACAVIAEAEVIGLEIAEFQGAWHDEGAAVSPEPVVEAIAPILARLLGP